MGGKRGGGAPSRNNTKLTRSHTSLGGVGETEKKWLQSGGVGVAVRDRRGGAQEDTAAP